MLQVRCKTCSKQVFLLVTCGQASPLTFCLRFSIYQTPVRVNKLVHYLKGYTCNIPVARFLLDSFSRGFPLNYQGPRQSFFATNLKSAIDNPMAVDVKISQELKLNRIAGPFDQPPFECFRVSPLGLVPKKVPGEYRMIHHLSFPKGQSVNDEISVEYSHVQYARIDDAIKPIKEVGQGCYLAKTDIKSAFRIIPIRPEDYPLLGMTWQEQFYFDKCMPMGCSSSCPTFAQGPHSAARSSRALLLSMESKAFSKSTKTMYSPVFHSRVCSTMILNVAIWSQQDLSLRNPACSSQSLPSRASFILSKMILQRTLLATAQEHNTSPV